MSEPIRILCVFGCLDRGGAETMCMNLYRHVDRNKVQFDFVTHSSNPGAYDAEIQSLGGKIFVAPAFHGWNLLKYIDWWKNHLKHHPEHQIIHGHYFTISGLYFYVAKKQGRTTVAHAHSTSSFADNKLIEKFFIKLIGKYADYNLACSEEAGQFIFPSDEFSVIKNAIESEKFAYKPESGCRIRKEFGVKNDQHIVGLIGNFTAVKNPMGSLAIMQMVLRDNPNSKLLWCGGGPLRKDIENQIAELKLEKSVILAGVRSDIPDILQAVDVFIMPSFYEGLPVSAVEAQAAGLPCVLSDRISRETAITDCCTFVPLEDMDIWVQAIEEGFRKGRSNTTQQIIDAGYDIHTTAKWLQDFYLEIAKKRI